MTRTQELKRPIRAWLREYPGDRLAALLAYAQDGGLSYWGCCCLLGCFNANHALQQDTIYCDGRHLESARIRAMSLGIRVESAYADLGYPAKHPRDPEEGVAMDQTHDKRRRRLLIPMILAEMRRRDRAGREKKDCQEKETAAVSLS